MPHAGVYLVTAHVLTGTAAGQGLADLARARGFDPTYYVDKPTERARPALRRLLRHARHAQLSAVVVNSLRDFGPGVVAWVRVLAELRHEGVPVVAAQEPWLELEAVSPYRVLEWAAVAESSNRAASTLVGLAAARAKGRAPGRPQRIGRHLLELALDLLREGKSVVQVAEVLGVHPDTLRRHRAIRALEPR